LEHSIIRVRHDTKRRHLTVHTVERLTPRMTRIVLAGDDLDDFVSMAPDDHIKLFFPTPAGEPERRDFTPRAYDRATRRLTIDFALHDAGPASDWAKRAKPGDTLEIGGPRGSLVVDASFDWWLLIGDETALPAIGRRLEELPASAKAISILAVAGAEEEQSFRTEASHHPIWVHRAPETADDPTPILSVLKNIELPAGDGFVFIAAEAGVARALRSHITDERGHPKHWMRAAGYWAKGDADAHVSLDA